MKKHFYSSHFGSRHWTFLILSIAQRWRWVCWLVGDGLRHCHHVDPQVLGSPRVKLWWTMGEWSSSIARGAPSGTLRRAGVPERATLRAPGRVALVPVRAAVLARYWFWQPGPPTLDAPRLPSGGRVAVGAARQKALRWLLKTIACVQGRWWVNFPKSFPTRNIDRT